jgi:hypothetical protein
MTVPTTNQGDRDTTSSPTSPLTTVLSQKPDPEGNETVPPNESDNDTRSDNSDSIAVSRKRRNKHDINMGTSARLIYPTYSKRRVENKLLPRMEEYGEKLTAGRSDNSDSKRLTRKQSNQGEKDVDRI